MDLFAAKLWFLFGLVLFAGLNLFLADLAVKRYGNFWAWFAFFFFVPVISWIIFIGMPIILKHKKNKILGIRMRGGKVDPDLAKLRDLIQHDPTEHSVTPFDKPVNK